MNALTDFLLARLAEEEADLPSEVAESHYQTWRAADWYKAEVAAKRAIVERHANSAAAGCAICSEAAREDVVCVEQRILASVYADHPDFQEEWRA